MFVCKVKVHYIASKPVFLSSPALAGCNPVPSSLPLHLESLVSVQAEGGELAGAVTMGGAGGKQRRLSENKVTMYEGRIFVDFLDFVPRV